MYDWICSQTDSASDSWLFCGEHTGLYSLTLAGYLQSSGIDLWLESGLQVSLSRGINRQKTDPSDARQLALYADRFVDKVRLYRLAESTLGDLRDLMAFRERLISIRSQLQVAAKELIRVKKENPISLFILQSCMEQLPSINQQINLVEEKVLLLIKQDASLAEHYKLLNTIPGIGMVNAVMILIATGNFTLFEDARKFACYCGVAPFQQQSGSSILGKARISHLANKKLKCLLTQAARSAIRHNKQIREYYLRKVDAGKPPKLVLNNVRDKLIHLIFALIRSKEDYCVDYINTLKVSA